MTLSVLALVISFVLGGVTFLPLLLAVVLGIIFFTSPVVSLPRKTGIPHLNPTTDEETEVVTIYRAGWLTVRRTYEPLLGPNDGTYIGAVVSGYRSFMDNRSRDPRRMKPKDKFYGVLKQSTLYLYDTEEQLECWAAVEVSAHDVIIYPEGILDGELFVKRNAVCLRPKGLVEAATDAHMASEDKSHDMEPGRSLPWFIFATVNTDKEDWFHSLVQASKLGSPTTEATFAKDRSMFDPEDMARLVDGIDQQPDSIPMRWLNAMLGRIFLSVYRTESLESYITSRIVRKLKRVKTPSMLSEVQVREVNIGSAAPFFSKPMLKDLTADGDASMEVHVSYVGDLRITIETVATINLGSRFKPYSVRLVLAVVLKEIEGTLLLKVKKPPSNRLWFGFSSMPRMVLNVEPVVSTRQIKWSMITSPIESRIREIILESIVVPHMDDFSFFNSSSFLHRGGIWGDALRKENDLSKPAGGAGDESTAIGHDDAVEDEPIGDATVSTSTGREDAAGASAMRSRTRRRRSSEGDSTKTPFTSDDAKPTLKGPASSSASSLSNFSLSSWREGRAKEKEATPPASQADKRKSWFTSGRAATLASTTPPTASPRGRPIALDDHSPASSATGEVEPELSASKLREILTRRAQSREREKKEELAAKTLLEVNDPTLAKKNSLSALSLTAPSTSNVEPVVPSINHFRADSAPPLLDNDSATTNYDSDASTNLVSHSPLASVPDLTLDPATPTAITSSPLLIPSASRSVSPSPASSPLSVSPDKSPPSLPARPSFTKDATPTRFPPPRRGTHQATASADASSMSFASAAATTSILASWRTRAAATDKQALAAGVAQAKDTMRRWGANWNAKRAGTLAGEDEYDEHDAASSPPQDMGRSLPSSRTASRSPPGSPTREGATYRDYRANKTRNGDYFGTASTESPSAPITIPETVKSSKSSDRKVSLSNGSSGRFTPAAPLPTTKLSTAPTFAPGSPPSGPSTSSPPAIARTYGRATMMAIPGIRDENVRKAVASDHVSAADQVKLASQPSSEAARRPAMEEARPVVDEITTTSSPSLSSTGSALPALPIAPEPVALAAPTMISETKPRPVPPPPPSRPTISSAEPEAIPSTENDPAKRRAPPPPPPRLVAPALPAEPSPVQPSPVEPSKIDTVPPPLEAQRAPSEESSEPSAGPMPKPVESALTPAAAPEMRTAAESQSADEPILRVAKELDPTTEAESAWGIDLSNEEDSKGAGEKRE